jgi:hypothetical protein
VKRKPLDKLLLVHLDGNLPVLMPVIFCRKGDLLTGNINDTMVADSNFVGISSQISGYMLWCGKRLFAIDYLNKVSVFFFNKINVKSVNVDNFNKKGRTFLGRLEKCM